jgi:hypothetical protein
MMHQSISWILLAVETRGLCQIIVMRLRLSSHLDYRLPYLVQQLVPNKVLTDCVFSSTGP